jgi:DNA-binding transcriptional MerR regulator
MVRIQRPGYNSIQVARICGVSLRQLQWWDERNVVSPRQDGHKRIYMAEEVVEISVIAELRRKGFRCRRSAACCASCKRTWASG